VCVRVCNKWRNDDVRSASEQIISGQLVFRSPKVNRHNSASHSTHVRARIHRHKGARIGRNGGLSPASQLLGYTDTVDLRLGLVPCRVIPCPPLANRAGKSEPPQQKEREGRGEETMAANTITRWVSRLGFCVCCSRRNEVADCEEEDNDTATTSDEDAATMAASTLEAMASIAPSSQQQQQQQQQQPLEPLQ